jgi:acyl-CoA thioester hydrolase
MTYRELEAGGLRLPVIEFAARFFRPARYDDVLEVRTQITALTGARISFGYEVRREGAEGALATGTTTHAAVDGGGRAIRLPAALRERLQ